MSARAPVLRCRRCNWTTTTLAGLAQHYNHAHPTAVPTATDLRPADVQEVRPMLEPGTGCVLVTCPHCDGRIGYRPGALCPCGWRPIPAVAS